MSSPLDADLEAGLLASRLRDLGLSIAGSRLAPGIAALQRELERAGIVRLRPDFYLSTEWGVPTGSVSIAIPFYLARADLIALHLKLAGYVEGAGRGDLLRYLRHEMGHVVNYAYRLHDRPEWIAQFGSMEHAYEEEYRPEPFCARYVRHLPGWYAQKHPDEDWAETFAVWLTPDHDWRSAYADWPTARTKLAYCDDVMRALASRDPEVTVVDHDEDVSELDLTVQAFYETRWGVGTADDASVLPAGLDGALQAIFEDLGGREDVTTTAPRVAAGVLIRSLEPELVANLYRWTGHFPERSRPLLRGLAERADALKQVYPADREREAIAALTTLVTVLAMNHVLRGNYLP